MAHTSDDVCFTVGVYIVHDGAVLLRKHDKYIEWFPVGGHIDPGENPNQAAIRECKEESGLDVELIGAVPDISEGAGWVELLPPAFLNIHKVGDTHRHCDMIYFACSKTKAITQSGNSDDVPEEDMNWFTAEELDDPKWDLRKTVVFYAKAAIVAASHQ